MAITEEKLRQLLVKKVGIERGARTRLAKEWGVTLTYVSGLVDGTKAISEEVASKLGYDADPQTFSKRKV